MKEHGINNQQDIHQRLLRNLSPPTSIPPRGCSVVTEKVSRSLRTQSLRTLAKDPGEPEDEIVDPTSVTAT
jgi:hypothetical protein